MAVPLTPVVDSMMSFGRRLHRLNITQIKQTIKVHYEQPQQQCKEKRNKPKRRLKESKPRGQETEGSQELRPCLATLQSCSPVFGNFQVFASFFAQIPRGH